MRNPSFLDKVIGTTASAFTGVKYAPWYYRAPENDEIRALEIL